MSHRQATQRPSTTTPPTRSERASLASERFVVGLAVALHRVGATAQRLEEKVSAVGEGLGLHTQLLATPTSVQIAFGPALGQHTQLVRVEPAQADLGKLSDLYAIADAVAAGRMSPTQGSVAVTMVNGRPARYRRAEVIASYGVIAAFISVFFGGGPMEIGASFVVGTAVGGLSQLIGGVPSRHLLLEPVGAMLATGLGGALSVWMPGLSAYVVIVSGLIVLLPGLTFTTGISEVAARHLVSGTARLAAAWTSLVLLAVGVALGAGLIGLPAQAWTAVPRAPLPEIWTLAALCAMAVANLVLFSAHPRDLHWVFLAGLVAWIGARVGAATLGHELGAVVGAFAVSAAANTFARLTGRPAALLALPGILVLVPGSVGFRGLALLLQSDVVSGVETAFRMALIGGGLVTGTLLANALIPSTRPAAFRAH